MANARERAEITPEILLRAYSIGLFPMAEDADDPALFWVEPEERGIFPLNGLVVSRSLAKTVRSGRFSVTVDQDFDGVIDACAAVGPGRETTWINARIRELYRHLYDDGLVHTVEAYRDGVLVGGLYGVAIGAAFFGESMFHLERDASKVALVHLVARLRAGRYRLLDTQFVTDHLAALGAIAVPKQRYRLLLSDAISHQTEASAWRDVPLSGAEALASAHNFGEAAH